MGSLVVVKAFFEVGGGRFEYLQILVPFFLKYEGGVLKKCIIWSFCGLLCGSHRKTFFFFSVGGGVF